MANPEANRLKSHFGSVEASAHGNQWDALWKDGSFLPWDRGQPSPALVDVLGSARDILGDALTQPGISSHQARRKALVPGCGRGYDCYLLQAQGWDVTGLDISEAAVQEARDQNKKIGGNEVYAVGKLGKGSLTFEAADFFTLDDKFYDQWDLIWDYTFLCALPPELRSKWSKQMSRLLSTAGRLVCLEFPTHKDPKAGGPPWALPSQTYIALLSRPSEEPKYGEDGVVLPEDQQGPVTSSALTRLAHFKPDRTFEIGKDTDRISIWCKR